MRWLRWIGALLCGCVLAFHAAAQGKPDALRVGLLAEAQPFHVWPAGDTPRGYDVDLLERVAADSGLRFDLRRYERWDVLLGDLAAGRVDLVTATARTVDREMWMAFTRAYARSAQGLAGPRDLTSVPSTPDLAGRRLALVRSFATEAIAAERFALASRQLYDSTTAALDAVERGEADLVLGTAAGLRAVLAERKDTRLAVLRIFEFEQGQRRLAMQLSNQALRDRLDAALAAIDPAAFRQWQARWLDRWQDQALPQIAPLPPGTTLQPLSVGYLPFDRPYSYTGAEGRAEGIAVQLMSAVAERAGVPIERFQPFALAEGLEALGAGRIDAMLALTDTSQRRQAMTFVGPYRDNPIVLVSRAVNPIGRLDQLSGRRLGMVQGYFAERVVRALHPDIELVGCRDFEDCMQLVADHRADAAMYGLQGTYGRLARHESLRLRISGAVSEVSDEHSLGLALGRADLAPRLRDAMQIALREDLPRIEREWHEREALPKIDWQRVRRWASAAALVLMMMAAGWWWHSRALRREIAKTRAAQAQSDQYLAFMAHEVRNSLQSVAGAVALLRGSSRPNARQMPLLEALGRSARSTLGLLNGLLDRHRLHQGSLEPTLRAESLERTIAAVVDEMTPAALAKGLTLRFERTAGLEGWWLIDALRVQQILRNLLINAVKFSDTGTITVSAALAPGARGGGWRRIALAVTDEGPGLDAQALERAFEPFESAGGDRPGTGLGLNLSRDLARVLGGTLDARSVPGQGATFTLSFEAEAGTEPEATRRGEVKRLLIVEDSPVYGLLLNQAFANQGIATTLCESVAQAREALIASVAGAGDTAPPFDLVLSDTHLGDGGVEDLLRFMREGVRPGVTMPPLICISADFADDEGERLLEAGALDLLVKDSDVAAFAARVLRAFAELASD